MNYLLRVSFTASLIFFVGQTNAKEIRVAVASNFIHAITRLAKRFDAKTGNKVVLISGSTGKLYAQIKNGAPYDIFFAADSKRPRLLVNEGAALSGSRFTYAVGKIVLWSPKMNYVDAKGKVLTQKPFHYLAMANPVLAPYGRAAQEVLQALHLWNSLKPKIVRGENIGQTFQFVKSGNAELGFIAYALLKLPGHKIGGSYWVVPTTLYQPIRQQVVLLNNNKTAQAFLAFVKTPEARGIIRSYGYDTP